MKKIILSLLASISLTSCSPGVSTEELDEPLFYTYDGAGFEMEIPDTWEVIKAFDSSYPNEVRIAFKNNIKEANFIANVIVILEAADEPMTNEDISQSKLKDNAGTLLNYSLEEQEEIELYVGGSKSSTYINKFSGKNTSKGYTFNFMQTYLTRGEDNWIVTATYLTDEDSFVIQRMEKMLKSFALE